MKTQSIPHLKEQRGIILVVAILVMAVLLILGMALLSMSGTEDAIVSNYQSQIQAFYAAEAGIESGVGELKALVAATDVPTDAELAALTPPTLSNASYSFASLQAQRVRSTPPYSYRVVVDSGPYAGLNAEATDYQVTAEVVGPTGSRARISHVVQHVEIPLFQYGAFYGRGVDLEVYPGRPMTFNGKVHANSDIYLTADGGGSLDFDSYLTSAGSIYRHKKWDSSINNSNPRVKDAGGVYQTLDFDHEYQPGLTSPWASEDDYVAHALSVYGGRVKDSAMGVQEILPPVPDILYDPVTPDTAAHQLIEAGDAGDSGAMKSAKMYYKADLRIHTNSFGTITATDKSGSSVDLTACNLSTPSFYDKREEATVTVTEVDVGALQSCGAMPANGILYVYNDVNVGDHKGVRLANGSNLPNGGLTVVSENPVYVQGDYNTVNKQPAAIMGDAVTVLSNSWGPNNFDTKGDLAPSDRKATDTTVNAAFMTGPSNEAVVEGGSGTGNGQLENVIRFLEDWTNVPITYNGSIVALWHSQQATAPWSYGVFYTAPTRNWGYDTLFDTSPPPGSPRGSLGVTRGRWTQE